MDLPLWPSGLHTHLGTHRTWVLNPGTGRYIVARMIAYNGGPLSLSPIASVRLKNLKDIDK